MAKKQTDARPGGTPIRSGEREQNSRCRKAGANDSSSATTLVASRTAGGPYVRPFRTNGGGVTRGVTHLDTTNFGADTASM